MRLTKIDESSIGDHARLLDGDECYYIYEYTSGRDFSFSQTNSLINNIKKKPTAPSNQLAYKTRDIAKCASDFRHVLNDSWVRSATVVPVPCSKARDHADYDNRMERIASSISPHLDVRNIVVQTASTAAAHEVGAGQRVTVEELLAVYEIDERLTNPPPTSIGILDDVLTAGTHYRAMKTVLSQRFGGIPIVGLFVARRVFPNPFEDL